MENKLKAFYDLLTMDTDHTVTINRTNGQEWIAILWEKNSDRRVGITITGEWIVVNSVQMHRLNTEKSFMYCMSFLEKSYEEITQEIRREFNDFVFECRSIFTFVEIVDFVFSGANDDYWFAYAMQWYQQFDYEDKVRLRASLEKSTLNKKLSQKNRHTAKRELKI